jgi:membrane-associated phospholipid phosphatase
MPARARTALLAAGVGVALLIITWFLAFHVGVFRHADRATYRGFTGLQPHLHSVATFIARLCNPKPFAFLAVVPLIVALARRRPRLALAIAAMLLGANVTTQLLKPLLAQPRPAGLSLGVSPSSASWPSGHATAAMSLALASVLAAPHRRRPVVGALGAVFAVAVSYSFLSLEWHYPSDVFGGYLVAATWALLVVAALYTSEGRGRRAPSLAPFPSVRGALGPPAVTLAGAILLVGVVAIARPHAVVSYARAHEVFMIGAAAIGVSALALASAVTLAVRR